MKLVIIPHWLKMRMEQSSIPLCDLVKPDGLKYILTDEELKIYYAVNMSRDHRFDTLTNWALDAVKKDCERVVNTYDSLPIRAFGEHHTPLSLLYVGKGFYELPKYGVTLEPVTINTDTMGLIAVARTTTSNGNDLIKSLLGHYSRFKTTEEVMATHLFKLYSSLTSS